MEIGRIADIDIIQICTAILDPGKLQYEESAKLHCAAEAPAARQPRKKNSEHLKCAPYRALI